MAGGIARRLFISALGGATVVWPLVARAQSGMMKRIGVITLYDEGDFEGQAILAAFRAAMDKLGSVAGRNIAIDYVWASNVSNRLATLAAELVKSNPDVIVANGTPLTQATRQATQTTPIVFVEASDPLASGLVASLARPGGNVTGFSNYEFSIGAKWLGLLKEIAPNVSRVLVLFLPGNAGNLGLLHSIEAAAPSTAVTVIPAGVREAGEIERAITDFASTSDGGLIVLPAIPLKARHDLIAALAAQYHLPAMYSSRAFIASGGLMSYVHNPIDSYIRAASYVDRILRGAKPADLPVQQPTKFELAINLKTAKALGLEVPSKLLAVADEVIE